MGWAPGQGLGKNSSGIKAPVKASTHKGTRGLGMKSDFTVGLKQIDEYASLLRALNDAHSNPDKPNLVGECLSTKSRRGTKAICAKDASKYSEKDLSIVLGRSEARLEKKKLTPNTSVSNYDVQFPTVVSSVSASEYFAKAKKRKLESAKQVFNALNMTSTECSKDSWRIDGLTTPISFDMCTNNHDNQYTTLTKSCDNQQSEDYNDVANLSIDEQCINQKTKKIETINAIENVIKMVFNQSNLLSVPGYCHY
ncbi:unnamed protein product [Heterobilharzia americana]|nr:unnamed protein product [Heterobilharzia americana]